MLRLARVGHVEHAIRPLGRRPLRNRGEVRRRIHETAVRLLNDHRQRLAIAVLVAVEEDAHRAIALLWRRRVGQSEARWRGL